MNEYAEGCAVCAHRKSFGLLPCVEHRNPGQSRLNMRPEDR